MSIVAESIRITSVPPPERKMLELERRILDLEQQVLRLQQMLGTLHAQNQGYHR